jgi:flagellar hook-basal body complex protein FliE
MQINNMAQINNLYQSNNVLNNTNPTTIGAATAIDTPESTDNSSGLSFADTLKEKLDEVNNQQVAGDTATEAFIKGDNVDVDQVMIAASEAQQSLQMAVQVRNKLVDAFQEINRMQL